MHTSLFLSLGLLPLALAQEQVQEAPPPPVVILSTIKSGVIPVLPSETPFAGVDTLQGAIISPRPPLPGYTGLLGTATAQSNQPTATYLASLPETPFNPLVGAPVQGSLEAVGGPNGVTFTVNITNLPDQAKYGPFNWHIHTLPVPDDGNCTATLSHFDPTNRGELYMCEAARPETCQVGDLAGKHGGKITTPKTFTTTFVDAYLSTQEGSAGFFGGLAFVLHTGNTTRITCANFEMVVGSGNGTSGGGNATGTTGVPGSTGTAMPPQFTGAAGGKIGASVGALAIAFAALLV
ncbi:Cu,Zn superoxide dismutase-like protein [Cucurbitaria berberidis CBS 394.84]|uniref:superoxide dismutase n=1 Tax=Cucurbitaria berberidis CBS 394.84 TaxID=1168544 RepID=A0A9P4GKP1_9PLEO|nr:Cu,Zn superoxide dismutase-like protein [Cucurbitaria berberidis CBS 394.84]KAF1847111.1 Cu,Zn superoxide dismutase-like protein [Cucurbitaria berberidis CBS 394.84]